MADIDLYSLLERFLDWLKINNFAEKTIINKKCDLNFFLSWCKERKITDVNSITRQVIIRYQKHLHNFGAHKKLSVGRQSTHLSSIRAFFRFLLKKRHILYSPASDIEMPKLVQQLPGQILTEDELEKILQQPDLSRSYGIKDRAIMETLYSTGMRRTELCMLDIPDVDMKQGVVFVHGKGAVDRYIPIGDRALLWIQKYLQKSRPVLFNGKESKSLFLNHLGKRVSPDGLSHTMRDYFIKADIKKPGSCHIFRHTMATLMLENGADIRFIQEILGHTRLETTQIYTRVSIAKLKEVHKKTHPRRVKSAEKLPEKS